MPQQRRLGLRRAVPRAGDDLAEEQVEAEGFELPVEPVAVLAQGDEPQPSQIQGLSSTSAIQGQGLSSLRWRGRSISSRLWASASRAASGERPQRSRISASGTRFRFASQ